MSAIHSVSFTAEDGRFTAVCTCGWQHYWTPWAEIDERDYTGILAIGLIHSLEGRTLPERVARAS